MNVRFTPHLIAKFKDIKSEEEPSVKGKLCLHCEGYVVRVT